MTFSSQVKDGELTISLGDRFDFSVVEQFRHSYKDKSPRSIVVDFMATSYMDSSGLGMLLNMKRHFNDAVPITLRGCSVGIKKVLMISRFETQFSIK